MEWVPDGVDGWRWELRVKSSQFLYEGKVLKMGMETEAWHADSNRTVKFKSMKEAAEWLVKRVTTGTGVQ
jgi:hypothetical protein